MTLRRLPSAERYSMHTPTPPSGLLTHLCVGVLSCLNHPRAWGFWGVHPSLLAVQDTRPSLQYVCLLPFYLHPSTVIPPTHTQLPTCPRHPPTQPAVGRGANFHVTPRRSQAPWLPSKTSGSFPHVGDLACHTTPLTLVRWLSRWRCPPVIGLLSAVGSREAEAGIVCGLALQRSAR